MDLAPIIAELPIERRLALAYAPGGARRLTLGLLALDQRLAAVLRQAREPLLGQLRLSWWRDQLRGGPGALPEGEPLLALLGEWGQRLGDLAELVDGWEGLLGDTPDFAGFARARGQGWAALAEALGYPDAGEAAARAGKQWALAELAIRVGDPAEREAVLTLIDAEQWSKSALPRALRPMTVLHGLALRSKGRSELLSGPVSALVAARLGLLGI